MRKINLFFVIVFLLGSVNGMGTGIKSLSCASLDVLADAQDDEQVVAAREDAQAKAWGFAKNDSHYKELLALLCADLLDVSLFNKDGFSLAQLAFDAGAENNVFLLLLFGADLDFVDTVTLERVKDTRLGKIFESISTYRGVVECSWGRAFCQLYPAIVDPIQEGIRMCSYEQRIQFFSDFMSCVGV